jgi:hypothetical protein
MLERPVFLLVWASLVIFALKVNAVEPPPQHAQVLAVVLLAKPKSLIALSAQQLHAVPRIVALLLQPLASKLVILFKNVPMAEFELLPFLAPTLHATKTFAVMRLVVLLICLCSVPIALSTSPTQVTAAPVKLAQATSAYLMSAVLQPAPVILISDALSALLFAHHPMVTSAPAPLALHKNAA